MAEPVVFVSHKRGDSWTRVAERFYIKLKAMAPSLGYEIFLDNEDLQGGDPWRPKLEAALSRTTHFVAFLCDEYWLSSECRRELDYAVHRFRTGNSPRLLFVLAEMMRPEHLLFDTHEHRGDVVTRVGDINFLGPFDAARRLTALRWDDSYILAQQMAQLADRLIATLRPPS